MTNAVEGLQPEIFWSVAHPAIPIQFIADSGDTGAVIGQAQAGTFLRRKGEEVGDQRPSVPFLGVRGEI